MHISKARLRDWIRTLKAMECTFWACEGPDKPFVHMMTCTKCQLIKEMRETMSAAFRNSM
jgi:hypothetical protein